MVGASVATVYRKINSCETVKNHLTKEKGCLYLDEEGFEVLKKSFQKEEPPAGNPETEYLKKLLEQQQSTIQELISRQAEERARADTIIMKLSNDLGSVRNLLEEAKKPIPLLSEPPKPVPVWEPEKPKNPLEGLAWYQQAWVKVFEPWRMRRYAS